jgi:hypothetical protein
MNNVCGPLKMSGAVPSTDQNVAVSSIAGTYETRCINFETDGGSSGNSIFNRNGAKVGSTTTGALVTLTSLTTVMAAFHQAPPAETSTRITSLLNAVVF